MLNDWRDHAVEGWARVAPADPGEPLEGLVDLKTLVLDGAARIDRRIEAAQALARSPMGGRMLIDLAEQGRLVYQIRQAVGPLIFSNPDAGVRTLASRYFLPPGGDREFDVDEIVELSVDPQRGRALFSASCSSCHQVAGSGGRVGPDLTSIGDKFDRTALVDAIVHPDGAVAFGYEPTILRLEDGRILIGQVLSEGDIVVLRDAAGSRLTADASDIRERRRLDVGLMPEPQQLGLSPADVADIAGFLRNRPTGG